MLETMEQQRQPGLSVGCSQKGGGSRFQSACDCRVGPAGGGADMRRGSDLMVMPEALCGPHPAVSTRSNVGG